MKCLCVGRIFSEPSHIHPPTHSPRFRFTTHPPRHPPTRPASQLASGQHSTSQTSPKPARQRRIACMGDIAKTLVRHSGGPVCDLGGRSSFGPARSGAGTGRSSFGPARSSFGPPRSETGFAMLQNVSRFGARRPSFGPGRSSFGPAFSGNSESQIQL